MAYTTENLDPAPTGAPVGNGNGDSAPNKSFAQELLAALLRYRDGDFSARMPSDVLGVEGKIADVFNGILAVSARRTSETVRVCREVGKKGKLKERMQVPGRSAAGPTTSARSTR